MITFIDSSQFWSYYRAIGDQISVFVMPFRVRECSILLELSNYEYDCLTVFFGDMLRDKPNFKKTKS